MNSIKNNLNADLSKKAPSYKPSPHLHSRMISISAFLSILLILVAYVWLISFGSWLKWPTTSNYYDQLAIAFEHRSFSLEAEPSRALLALSNPYDPSERNGINYPKDFSLYNSKYYLYFGPVPGLIVVFAKSLGLKTSGDQYPVFTFVSGIFLFQSLIILKIWKHFFQNIPIWLLSICILFSGLASPFTWILTQARIYEAAASAGQLFFLAGFYFIVVALE